METDLDDQTMSRDLTNASEPQVAEFEPGILDTYIAYHLRLAQNASFRAFQRKTGQHDLKPGWFAVLSLIGDNPGITPMALSRGSGRDKSTLTPVLRDMLTGGYVERIASATDRRSYGLTLTEAGKCRLAEFSARAAEHDARLDAIVGEQKAELIALLRRIAAEIE
ncbi:MarR family transcriptional regulator [Chelativorans sp. ZYF759]|uniref:MarR family winged helix-turn-helix transcriptional regulator n=1 Tax=Chelativorans sp. ZYF759 TaxID=2692213 RepID=UPI00145E03B5|nr:MarR family transcriptional regulator [Chelativorans sp. ZYF759]NMG39491.1 MarR family transcriptional regulator [Chelativorans sp. ZYF759]